MGQVVRSFDSLKIDLGGCRRPPAGWCHLKYPTTSVHHVLSQFNRTAMMMPPPPSKVPGPLRKVQDMWTKGGHRAFHYTVIPAIFAYGKSPSRTLSLPTRFMSNYYVLLRPLSSG